MVMFVYYLSLPDETERLVSELRNLVCLIPCCILDCLQQCSCKWPMNIYYLNNIFILFWVFEYALSLAGQPLLFSPLCAHFD